jgi:hypothetical protein
MQTPPFDSTPASVSRRKLLAMLPTGAAACAGCAAAPLFAQQTPASREHSPTEKADMTWEQIFRFTYQRNYIPTLKALQAQIGKDKLVAALQQGLSEAAIAGMAKNPAKDRDFATWVKGLRAVPPLYQHALVYEVVEDTPKAFEIRVSQCLWARMFREEDAADIGYAGICHPDFAAAAGFNPKIKLHRTKTLMQGHDCCNHRYVVEAETTFAQQ